MVSIDYGFFISEDGINEVGWGWFVICGWVCGDSEQTVMARYCDGVGEDSKKNMKAQQKEGVNRVMYDHLNALMTFPSTYKDLMEDALSHVKWKERVKQRGEAKIASRKPQKTK